MLCLCAMSVPLVSLWWTGRVAGRERVGGVGGAAPVLENRKQNFSVQLNALAQRPSRKPEIVICASFTFFGFMRSLF